MLKNILNLEGAQKLSKEEQKSILGGKKFCTNPLVSNECFDRGIGCIEPHCQLDPGTHPYP